MHLFPNIILRKSNLNDIEENLTAIIFAKIIRMVFA